MRSGSCTTCTADPTELRNLAAEEPERVKEMAAAWEELAWAHYVYPLDEGSSIKYLQRPGRSEVYGEPVTIRRGTPTLERWRSVQLLWFRSVNIRVQLHHRAGDEGMLVAHGDQGAGYALYVLGDELFFVHNNGRGSMLTVSGGVMAEGVSEVVADLRGDRRAAVGAHALGRRRGGGPPSRVSRCCSASLRSRASTSGSTAGRRCRGRSTRSSARSRTRASSHAVTYTPGEPGPDAPVRMMDMLRDLGAAFE